MTGPGDSPPEGAPLRGSLAPRGGGASPPAGPPSGPPASPPGGFGPPGGPAPGSPGAPSWGPPSPAAAPPWGGSVPADGGAPPWGAPAAPGMPPGAVGQSPAAPKRSRRVWIGVGATAVLVAGGAGFALTRGGSDDGAGDTTIVERVLSGTVPSGEPEEAWSYDLDDRSPGAVAIADGSTIVALTSYESEGGEVEVVALDDTGEERWSTDVDGSFMSAAIVTEQGILISGESIELIDPTDGRSRWSDDDASVEALAGDVVIVSDQDEESVSAVALASGDERWQVDGSVGAQCGSAVYVNDDDDVSSIDLASGKERWSASGVSGHGCDEDAVYGYDDGELVALGRTDGEERWNGGEVSVGDVVDGVVLVTDNDDGELRGLRADTGEKLWESDLDGGGGVLGLPGGRVATYESDGDSTTITVIDPRTGEELEDFKGDQTAFGRDGFIIHHGGRVEAVRYQSLEQTAEFDFDADDGSIVGVGDRAVLMLVDGDLVAYR